MITILDGPVGTELTARGVETQLPLWSAVAIETAPEILAAIHRDYAEAGAVVHTANTFRTQPRRAGSDWQRLLRRAVEIVRRNVPSQHRVAGSMAPLEDCYRPDLSPADSRGEHRMMASELAAAGCDILLCETFAHAGEAMVAAQEALATGVETWVAFTAGPSGDLMTPAEMADAAKVVVRLGASAVLVNCTPVSQTLQFVETLVAADLSVAIGVYANAGSPADGLGWTAPADSSAAAYRRHAKLWVEAGAVIVGGCCGTGPEHIRALAGLEFFAPNPPPNHFRS